MGPGLVWGGPGVFRRTTVLLFIFRTLRFIDFHKAPFPFDCANNLRYCKAIKLGFIELKRVERLIF